MATNRSELEVRVTGRDELSPQFDKLESRLIRFVGFIGAGIAAIRISSAPIRFAADFERELANVRKTTNFTKEGIRQLSRELLTMSTRVDIAATDLAKIAAAAGQQGLGRAGVEGVVAFTDSVSRMASVLDITAEQAADDVGKIVNIFKIPLKDIENAVSTFNEVSNNSTAKGKELLDVVKRIGDAAGQLDLAQATAIGATGLDFGLTPEVVGTSFSKIFLVMQQKADVLGRLLNKPVEDFVANLKGNGIQTLTDVLKRLRELAPQAQQDTIVKLFGGGRIGGLVNKLVQDVSDSVLEQNFRSAQEGLKGRSAIEEQRTVLETLTAQSKIALNAIQRLGIQAAEEGLAPLTAYAARLTQLLQEPGVQRFATESLKALGDLAKLFLDLAEFVGRLNVNWENFIGVAKAFALLKLAEIAGRYGAGFLGLGGVLKSTSKDADGTAKSLKELGVAQAAFSGQLGAKLIDKAGLTELVTNLRARTEATKNLAAAEKAQAEARRRQSVAELQDELARSRLRAELNPLSAASGANASQSARYKAAAAAVDQTRAAQQAALNAALQAKETEHTTRMAQIEAGFQARRAQIRATGTEVGLTQAKRERETYLAEEQTRHNRSLASTQSYWARRNAIQLAGLEAAALAERRALAATQSSFDSAVAATASRQSAVAASSTALAAAGSGVAAATASLTFAQRAANLASAAVTNFGVLFRAAAGIVAAGARLIFSAFAWVTIIYSIADAFGIIDRLAPLFTKLSDAIGITSRASRDAQIARDLSIKKIKEESDALNDLIEKNKQYVDVVSGRLSTIDTEASRQRLINADTPVAKEAAIKELADQYRAAQGQIKQAADAIASANAESLDKQREDLRKYQGQVSAIRAQIEAESKAQRPGQAFTSDLQQVLANSQRLADETQKKIETLTQGTEAAQRKIKELTASSNTLGNEFASFFTKATAAVAEQYLPRLFAIQKATEDLEKKERELYALQQTNQPETIARYQLVKLQLELVRGRLTDARDEVVNYIKEQQKIPGLPDAVRQSWEFLLSLIGANTEAASAFTKAALDAIKANPAAASGASVPAKPTSPTGTDQFSVRDARAKASELAKARLAVARAASERILELQQEEDRQRQEDSERAYAKGLKSIQDYYADRLRIQQKGIDNEIAKRRADLAAVNAEKPENDAAALRLQAQRIKLLGEIDVLNKSRVGITAQITADTANATDAFAQEVRRETNRITSEGLFGPGIGSDIPTIFQSNLDEALEQYKVFLNKIGESNPALAAAIRRSATVDALSKAFEPTFKTLSRSFDELNLFERRLAILREQGKITSQDVVNSFAEAAKGSIGTMQVNLGTLTAQLNEFDRKIAEADPLEQQALRASDAYRALVNRIKEVGFAIVDLSTKVNATAISVNEGLTGSIADALSKLEFTAKGIRNLFTSVITDVAQQVKTLFAKSLAENISTSIGSTGAGGFGGFIQGLLKRTGSTPDGSERNPFHVIPPNSGVPGLTQESAASKDIQKVLDSGWEKAKEIFNNFPSTLLETFGEIGSFFSSTFNSLVNSLSSIFSSSGGGGGGIFSTILSFFAVAHTGGVVGSTKLATRLANPAIFNRAARFANGGIAGLGPDEVPIIAHKGEEIVRADDPRHRNNQGQEGAPSDGGIKTVSVYVVTPDKVPPTSPRDIIVTVGDDIMRSGSLKRLIQEVQAGRI